MARTEPGTLGEAVYRYITGQSSATESMTVAARVREIERKAGGRRQAADLLGVSRETVRRWAAGIQAPGRPDVQENILRIQRHLRLPPAREQRIRSVVAGAKGAPRRTQVIVEGKSRYDGRDREIDVSRYLRAGTMWSLVNDYLRGATPAELGKALADGVTDPVYRQMLLPRATEAQFGMKVSKFRVV